MTVAKNGSLDRMLLSDGTVAYFRSNTSDERVLREVILNRIYRRKGMNFDVYRGERWLDLGANIGAFALYCKVRGATAECYEPEPSCFAILRLNIPSDWPTHNYAVTNLPESMLPFYKGRLPGDHYRGTLFPTRGLPRHECEYVGNRYGDFLRELEFDGVKMDIEGAEAGLLDEEMVPRCKKLVMEYHTSRDPSMTNLKRRLDFLHSRFKTVRYPPEYDRLIAAGGNTKTFFDRMVYCKDPR